MNILALEISTTSAKAMIWHTADDSCDVLTKPFSRPASGSLFSADEVVKAAVECGRELASGRQIDAVSLSSVWHSLILRDNDMNPVSPLYHWDYTEPALLCRTLSTNKEWCRDYYHRTGCFVNPIYPSFRIRYFQERFPEIEKAAFMSIGSYLTWTLTGQMISTRCLASGSGLLNINSGDYDKEILNWLNIRSEQLSTLSDSMVTIPLSSEGASLLGLTQGIPVIPANSDGALNQVGAGALRKGIATLSAGTSGAVRMASDRPVIPDNPSTWCYRSPAGYLSGAATNGCCNCIDWAKKTLFAPGTSYEEMESGGNYRPDTPVFLPFLFGERCPGWDGTRLGGFSQLSPGHDKYDMYQAVQEGVLFNLYQCYSILAELEGHAKEIRISGGILNSEKWLQMCADIFGCTLKVNKMQQGSLFGACVLAAGVLGEINDLTEYNPAVIREVIPDPDRAGQYHDKYQKYLEAYKM